MDIELWKKYADTKRSGTVDEKLAIMLECAEMEEDEILCRDARYDLAQLFLKGEGVDKDREQAIELLKSSADMGNINAMELVGSLLIEEGGAEEGNAYLQRAKETKLSNGELEQLASDITDRIKKKVGESDAEENQAYETDNRQTKKQTNPFGLIDVIIYAVVAAVPALIIKWIFHISFFWPWIILTLILSINTYRSDKKERKNNK